MERMQDSDEVAAGSFNEIRANQIRIRAAVKDLLSEMDRFEAEIF